MSTSNLLFNEDFYLESNDVTFWTFYNKENIKSQSNELSPNDLYDLFVVVVGKRIGGGNKQKGR